jgi:hypothetical protein
VHSDPTLKGSHFICGFFEPFVTVIYGRSFGGVAPGYYLSRLQGEGLTRPLLQVLLNCFITHHYLLIRRVLPAPLIERLILRETSSA